MSQQKPKPAVILDDDRNWSTNIARGIRRFAGLPVKHFLSIESFCRHHKIQYSDTEALGNALRDYSAVVCDNNFEGAEGQPGDGFLGGGDFLLTYAGPALKNIPASERPIVMSFAPSSEDVIKKYENAMWERYGITSFHKFWETAAIGLTIRIAREYGVSLSRESVVSKICRQSLGDTDSGSPKSKFFFDLRYDHTEDGSFDKEGLSQAEGDAIPLEWTEITKSLAQKLEMPEKKLIKNIENEVAQRRIELEGSGNPGQKK